MRKYSTLIALCTLFCYVAPTSALPRSAASHPGPDIVRLSLEESILFLSGASDISEIPEDEYERYSMLQTHPLRINRCSRSSLLTSGLFSQYQAETIMDYRSRCGDILSPEELSIVDGFTPHLVSYLAAFLDFSPKRADGIITSGDAMSGSRSGGLTCGASYKIADGRDSWQWKVKAAIEADSNMGIFSFSFAGKSPWIQGYLTAPDHSGASSGGSSEVLERLRASLPQDLSWSLSWEDPRGISKIYAGCFNVRQGQGLLLWTGTQFSSYSTPSSLMKRPSGIAAYRSYSPSYSMSGIAASINAGRFSINSFIDFGDIFTHIGPGRAANTGLPDSFGGSLVWSHSNGRVGINAVILPVCQGYSVDCQYTVAGIVLYGEFCGKIEGIGWKGRSSTLVPDLSALCGITFHIGKVELGLRLSRQKEHNLSAAMSWLSADRRHSLDFGVTATGTLSGIHQSPGSRLTAHLSSLKSQATYKATPDSSWQFTTRLYVNAKKYDLRQDIRYAYSGWRFAGRVNFAYSRMPAWLGYTECGYVAKLREPFRLSVSAYGQAGIFKVDNWDDRIYVYMRDAPGNFNVPAMYGRGYWLSAYATAKFQRHYSLTFRIQYTGYPWARPTDTHRRPSLAANLLFQFLF